MLLMNKIIIANWKANPASLEEAKELFNLELAAADQFPSVQTVICPPPDFLEELAKINSLHLGAQDIDIPRALQSLIGHVLVGHSDRRYKLDESDEVVNQKLKAALEAAVVPILLVGERKKRESREEILTVQLERDLAGLTAEQVSKILFTYEPVWAISTNPGGEADTPENAVSAIKFIQNLLITNYGLPTINCLYGGSVSEKNAADFLKHQEVSGAVVGGASLHPEEFANILKIASSL